MMMKLKKTIESICTANEIQKKDVLLAIELGATTLHEIESKISICGNCGCREKVQELLDRHAKKTFRAI